MSDALAGQDDQTADNALLALADAVEHLAPLLCSYAASRRAIDRAGCLAGVRQMAALSARIVADDEADTATTARAIVDAIFTAPADAEVANADVKPG